MLSSKKTTNSAKRLELFCRLGVLWMMASIGLNPAAGFSAASDSFGGSLARSTWPLFFEPCGGAAGSPANFQARGPNYQLIVGPAEVNFFLRKPQARPDRNSIRREEATQVKGGPVRVVRISFESDDPQATICGTGEMEAKVNYLVGKDPTRWRTEVSTFSGVKVQGVYRGVDLVYYETHGQLEYDFTVAPRVDPGKICLHFEGPEKLTINAAGELVVGLDDAELVQRRPLIYQIVNGTSREVSGGYQLKDSHTVCFKVGSYNQDLPLVIDPVFSYATYFGGNSGDTGLAIKVDSDGSVFLAGETLSMQFPSWPQTNSPFQSQNRGGSVTGDAFIAKLDNTGSKLIYFTYLGGTADDGAYDLAIDSGGNAYITGFTVSPDFPTKNALFSQIGGIAAPNFNLYPPDAFVAEINTNGSGLVFSTYLGGNTNDVGSAIAVDPTGFIYVAGFSGSSNFPVVNALQPGLLGINNAFVTKLAPGGSSIIYSTYLGGSGADQGEGIAVDGSGNVYVAGSTSSVDFPITAGAFQTNLNLTGTVVSVFDAFLTKLAMNGSLLYSTYLGGENNDFGYRVAVDNSGNAYLAGATQSPDFPRTNSFNLPIGEDGTNVLNFDAFLTKFDPAGNVIYSTQFGGTDNDVAWGVAVDVLEHVYVIGTTLSTNFPVVNSFGLFQPTNSGGKDIFMTIFDTSAPIVVYSVYLGGPSDDFGYAITLDGERNIYLSGMTFSTGFPTTPGVPQNFLDGTNDAFIAKIRLQDPFLSVKQEGIDFRLAWPATAPDYVLQSTTDPYFRRFWTNVAQTPMLTNGQYVVDFISTNTYTFFRLLHP